MSQKSKSKHILFSQTYIDIMDELIKEKSGINNYADAVRYALLSLKKGTDQTENGELQRKLNAMSKNIDILTEMVAGGFHYSDIHAIGKAEETYIYKDAKKNVENKIQRSTTVRSNQKASQKANMLDSTPSTPSTPNSSISSSASGSNITSNTSGHYSSRHFKF
ncbi:hypothetical protein QUF84_00485 [Fictibacillus enclensis]|uniref:hypothetical protein n=1 Tax=Fictibacillus enclensis TaxID=1017270 RepID=UPI00259FE55E|nr:hypothetical protein [Fictibacillus enclensis]MDM5335773.1 hypothetical protein [Fictibacillus enclensis]